MRALTDNEFRRLTTRPKVKKIAVENYLSTLSGNQSDDVYNLMSDSILYGWNSVTVKAIQEGIRLAYSG